MSLAQKRKYSLSQLKDMIVTQDSYLENPIKWEMICKILGKQEGYYLLKSVSDQSYFASVNSQVTVGINKRSGDLQIKIACKEAFFAQSIVAEQLWFYFIKPRLGAKKPQ